MPKEATTQVISGTTDDAAFQQEIRIDRSFSCSWKLTMNTYK